MLGVPHELRDGGFELSQISPGWKAAMFIYARNVESAKNRVRGRRIDMIFIIGLIIGCVIGFCGCAFFAANKINRMEYRLQSADNIVGLVTKVGDYLNLWDDHEFDELREAIDKHEEE
jgi:hypothetical protein